jgi:putative pyruvate formate lyase activating enzyme
MLGALEAAFDPDETEAILRWISEELGPETYVNLMQQSYPAGLVTRGDDFTEINRQLSRTEYESAVELASSLGLRLDHRSVAAGRALSRRRLN